MTNPLESDAFHWIQCHSATSSLSSSNEKAKPYFSRAPPCRRRHNALHKRRRARSARSFGIPADLVTNTPMDTKGRAPHAVGDAAGQGGLRGAAALADSPLLGRRPGEWSHVFDAKVLPLLDPTTRALLGRVGQACRDAVLRFPKLPCAGRTVGVKLKVKEFIVSVQLLAFGPRQTGTRGMPGFVRWPRGPGTWRRCSGLESAAARGMRRRVHNYPWSAWSCANAALGSQLEALKWLREHHCPWDVRTVERATAAGHDAVLQWALDNGCPS